MRVLFQRYAYLRRGARIKASDRYFNRWNAKDRNKGSNGYPQTERNCEATTENCSVVHFPKIASL